MHIPDGFLNNQVSAGMAAVAAVAVVKSFRAVRAEVRVRVAIVQQQLATTGNTVVNGARNLSLHLSRVASQKVNAMAQLAGLIFALQMINFPVQNGTSGHFLGAALATIVLGPAAAVLVMTVVVGIQAFFFADGGIVALGANLVNMAVLPVAVVFLLNRLAGKRIGSTNTRGVLFFALAWLSVVVAAIAASLELALSGVASLSQIVSAMLPVHMLIGLGEGAITLLVMGLFFRERFNRDSAEVQHE